MDIYGGIKKKDATLIENLGILKNLLDANGIEFWLDWGTLLGAIREGNIIPWDNDLDIGIFKKDLEKLLSIMPRIKKSGFHLKEPILLNPASAFGIWRNNYGLDFEIYDDIDDKHFTEFHYKITDRNATAHLVWFLFRIFGCGNHAEMPQNKIKYIFAAMLKYPILIIPASARIKIAAMLEKILFKKNWIIFVKVSVPKKYFSQFKKINIFGMNLNIPAESEEYLEHKYGKTWRTPNPKWNWSRAGDYKAQIEHETKP